VSLLLQVSDLSFAHSDAAPVLTAASFTLPVGITGVVGPNGSGKSTLLSLLAGALRPRAGSVRVPGPVARCPQEPALDDAVRAFAWGWIDGAWAVQARLGLDPAALDRWEACSPGERRRWQLGAALAAAPATLLLDEPTNHLDADGRAWLVEALRAFRGIAVVVTHDRALSDAVCARTLRLRDAEVRLTAGGYSAAKAVWDAEEARVREVLAGATQAADRARRHLADARRERDGAAAGAKTRPKGPRDSDGRSLNRKGRAERALATASRRVAVARGEAARAAEVREATTRPGVDGAPLALPSAPGAPARVLAWRGELRVGSRAVPDVEVVVRRGERWHVDGPNGSGKSTLLRALYAGCALPAERILWVPQELDPARTAARLAAVRALPGAARGRVGEVLAALGVAPERVLASGNPSPGEARKLALAEGLARGAWLALLDEPTNHLDLPSIERLQAALAAWDGALVLVSHDLPLAAAVTTRRLRWPPG
jgi:ATPase subunit of ABC transporter with duplicated ATPase domains